MVPYLPTLSASGQWQRTQQERVVGSTAPQLIQGILIPAQPGGAQTTVGGPVFCGTQLNYTIFDGLGREGRLGQATSNASSVEQTSERTKQAIVYQTESSYLNVLRNEQLVKVSEENLKRDQQQLERITESNKVGALALADVYRQQSQVAADEFDLITAQNNFGTSKADMEALIGLDLLKEYSFADSSLSPEISKEELDSTKAKYMDYPGTQQTGAHLPAPTISARSMLSMLPNRVSRRHEADIFPRWALLPGITSTVISFPR